MNLIPSRRIQLSRASTQSIGKYDANYGEYAVNWRDIIFLPFNSFWELFVTIDVFLSMIVITYDFAYDTNVHNAQILDIMYYILETVYFLDTAFFIIHR